VFLSYFLGLLVSGRLKLEIAQLKKF